MEDFKEGRKNEQERHKLKKRKKEIDKIISKKRGLLSSNLDLPQEIEIEEEKEEELCKPEKGYLTLNQYQKHHYHPRKKKNKKCWICGSRWHLKRDCTKLSFFYCGAKGHIKQKCWKYELHIAIRMLKGKKVEEQKETKNKQKRTKTATDRMKEMVFRQEGEQYIMTHKGQDLAIYSGDYPFEKARGGFEPPRLPHWQMEKAIKNDLQVNKLKISDYLPHQCGADGEVLNGKSFLVHCQFEHRNWVPKGSLIKASPYRFWLLWYSEENFIKFMRDRGEIQYIKANPPWID